MNKPASLFLSQTATKALGVTLIAMSATAGVFLVTRWLGAPGLNINQTSTQKIGTFDVSGEGEATVVPDKAELSIGFNTTQTTVAQTQSEMNRVINAVTEKLAELGIDKKDIKTVNYSLYPNYDNTIYPMGAADSVGVSVTKSSAGSAGGSTGVASSEPSMGAAEPAIAIAPEQDLMYTQPAPDFMPKDRRTRGFTGDVTLMVTMTDFDKVNEAIDAATAAGANQVGGVQFGLQDKTQEKADKEAREEAISKAKEKAQELARLSGMRLGKIVNISESPYGYMPMYSRSAAFEAKGGDMVQTNIEPGSTTIRYTITISYETL